MERSALYRRALAPVFTVAGIFGVVSALLGWLFQVGQTGSFVVWWLGVAAFGLVVAFLMIRRQAWQAGESFWTLPTKRVTAALAPAIIAGLVVTILIARLPLDSHSEILLLVAWWHLSYGLALMSAGFFTPHGIRRLGGTFLCCGLVIAALYGDPRAAFLINPISQHLMMGVTFGLGHLLAAGWLRATEPSREP